MMLHEQGTSYHCGASLPVGQRVWRAPQWELEPAVNRLSDERQDAAGCFFPAVVSARCPNWTREIMLAMLEM